MATENTYHQKHYTFGEWVTHMSRESWLPECPTILPADLADSRDWSLIGWSKVCPELSIYEAKLNGYHYIIKQFNGGDCTWDVTRMPLMDLEV